MSLMAQDLDSLKYEIEKKLNSKEKLHTHTRNTYWKNANKYLKHHQFSVRKFAFNHMASTKFNNVGELGGILGVKILDRKTAALKEKLHLVANIPYAPAQKEAQKLLQDLEFPKELKHERLNTSGISKVIKHFKDTNNFFYGKLAILNHIFITEQDFSEWFNKKPKTELFTFSYYNPTQGCIQSIPTTDLYFFVKYLGPNPNLYDTVSPHEKNRRTIKSLYLKLEKQINILKSATATIKASPLKKEILHLKDAYQKLLDRIKLLWTSYEALYRQNINDYSNFYDKCKKIIIKNNSNRRKVNQQIKELNGIMKTPWVDMFKIQEVQGIQ